MSLNSKVLFLVPAASLFLVTLIGDRTSVQPGANLFTVHQDIEAARTEPQLAGLIAHQIAGYSTGSPSSRLISYRDQDLEFRYPENWSVTESGDTFFIAPPNGFVSGSLAYGMTIASFEPEAESSFGQRFESPDNASQRSTLSRATQQLIEELQRSNPNMKVKTAERRRVVDGEPALTLELTNDSPLGGSETDWLVTVLRPDGLLYYFVAVAPRQEFSRYMPTFEQIIASVRFYD